MRICGLEFTSDAIDWISQRLDEEPLTSRRSLARDLCQRMGWKAASGRPKEMVCRKALVVLDTEDVIDLPKSDGMPSRERKARPRLACSVQAAHIACELRELGHVEIERITSRYSKGAMIFREWLDSYHYLGSGPLCGAQIRYLIHSSHLGYLGAVAFSSAAWALKERDEFIGWTEAARRRNLAQVVCNSRFLIVPTVEVKNLASYVLGQCARRVGKDWKERYGIEPVLIETFVDPRRFSGTIYRAANWIHVGETSGRRGAQREEGGGRKEIFLYPLREGWQWQKVLCTEPQRRLGERARPTDAADWVEEEFSTAEFYDPRLRKRLFRVVRDFYTQPQAPIPQACPSHASTKAAYRFFDNKRVSMEGVLSPHIESTVERIKGKHVVLAVQDTTTVNDTTHRATEGLGPIGTQSQGSVGLVVHDTMAFTPEGTPLGLLNVQCWARDPKEKGKKHRRKELPIEQKESAKWIKSYEAVREVQKLCPETMLVSVGDRESDIYELFLEATQQPDAPKLLVRCERSRNRKTDAGYLWEQVAKEPVAGILGVHIPRKGCQLDRDAKLEVRYAQITLMPPRDTKYRPIGVFMVYVREIDYSKAVASPLEWMLLTTVEVSHFEQACERVFWYAARWGIEVYHRTMKSGCRIEDRRLETAESLESCLAIDMVVAWRIYHLVKLSREIPDSPCTVFFEEAEWKALYLYVNNTLELPDRPPTLREATRRLASLGGFLGRKGDGEPGTTTLWRGIQCLKYIATTYLLLLPRLRAGP